MKSKVWLFTPLFFLILVACDLFLKLDKTPPVCIISFPSDSALVSGIVKIQAEAFDSVGVAAIEFYVDGSLIAQDSNSQATAEWDTRQLAENSWHQIFCIATDLANNKGYSDTVQVQIFKSAQRNVFHGQIILQDRYYWWVNFDATVGETVLGDARATPEGTISRFSLLDQSNFDKYRSGKSYIPLYEQTNLAELTLNYQFTTTGKFYLIFLNTTGKTQTYWARFVIQ